MGTMKTPSDLDADREARARQKLAAYRRQLAADPENVDVRAWVRRYEGVVNAYIQNRLLDRLARRALLILRAWAARN